MITMQIGSAEREFDDDLRNVDEAWILEQIRRRRVDGQGVCVRVSIHVGDINAVFSTPACSRFAGGGRPPNNAERELFLCWSKLGLDKCDFSPEAVVAFLRQCRRHW